MITFSRFNTWRCMAIALIALPFSSLTAADEPQTVHLRANLVAQGDMITLGDVFAAAHGADTGWASTPLTPAPPPGRAATLDPTWLMNQARSHGLAWDNAGGVLRVSVRTASQTVASSELEERLSHAIANDRRGDWLVTLNGPQIRHAPVGADLSLRILSWRLDTHGRLSAEIEWVVGGPPVTVAGNAEPAAVYATLATPLARGERLRDTHVAWTRGPQTRMPSGALTDIAPVLGHAARRPLRAGQTLRANDLAPPLAVRRGEPALLVYQSGRLTLTARARALDDAPVGEPARFTSLASGRPVEAWVEAPGRARVGPPPPTALN